MGEARRRKQLGITEPKTRNDAKPIRRPIVGMIGGGRYRGYIPMTAMFAAMAATMPVRKATK